MVYYQEVKCHGEKLVHFNVKVTARAYIIENGLFSLYLLNCCFVCNQTWLGSTASKARVFCGKVGLLHSRSRSQWWFQNVNVCQDDIYLLKHRKFVTKPGMVMQHHKPECHAEKLVYCVQCQGHSKGSYNQIWLFLLYLLNCLSICNQTWSDGTAL